MDYTRKVLCKESYWENDDQFWTEDKVYDANKNLDGTWTIETDFGTEGMVGRGYMLDDFNEYFEDVTKKVSLQEVVETAYKNGYFQIDKDGDGDGLYVKTPDNYFYAFGEEGDTYEGTAKEYIKFRGEENICKDIAQVLNDFVADDEGYNARETLIYLLEIKEHNYAPDNQEYDRFLDLWIDRASLAVEYNEASEENRDWHFISEKIEEWITKTFQEKGYIINPDIDFKKDLVPESDDLFYEGNEETHACDFEFQTESMDMYKIFPDLYEYLTENFEDVILYGYMDFYAMLSEKDSPSIEIYVNYETYDNDKMVFQIPMTEKQRNDLQKVLMEYREQEEAKDRDEGERE